MRLPLLLLLAIFGEWVLASSWQPIGPNGAPLMVLKAPDSAGERVYAVNAYGMYRSDDRGGTWQWIDPPENRRKFPSASQWALSHSSTDTLLAVFDDRYVYRSVNAGASWSSVPTHGEMELLDGQIISSVMLDPADADRLSVFIGTTVFRPFPSSVPSWLQSEDGGNTIHPADGGLGQGCPFSSSSRDAVVAAAVDPYRPDRVVLSKVYSCDSPLVGWDYELIEYTNGTRVVVAQGWRPLESALEAPDSRIAFDQDHIYWKINQALVRVDRVSGMASTIHNDVFDVVATESSSLLASTPEGLLASTSAGSQWLGLTDPSFGGDGPTAHWAYSAAVLAGEELLAAGSESVFALVPGDSEWIERSNGLQAMPAYGLLATPSGRVWARTFSLLQWGAIPHSGLYATSSDGGDSWHGSNINSLINTISSLVRVAGSPDELYASGNPTCWWQSACPDGSIPSNGIVFSIDAGSSWSPLPELETAPTGQFAFIAASRVSDVATTILASRRTQSSTFLYRSYDSGQSWSPGNSGFSEPVKDFVDVTALVASPAAHNRFYIGTLASAGPGAAYPVADVGFYRSHDAGATWQHASTGLPRFAPDGSHTGVLTIAAHPQDTDRLWLLTGERLAGSTEFRNRVYRTTDGGDTWNEASDGLPVGDYRSLLVDPVRPDYLYVAGFSGVYFSTNGGQRWVPLGTVQPPLIRSVASSEAHVYVGTDRQGAFRIVRPHTLDPIFLGDFESAD